MSVTINRRLNIVIPVERPDGSVVHVHALPLGREIIENYGFILGTAYAAIEEMGIRDSAGPNMAMVVLKSIANRSKAWETVQNGLLPELFRTCMVLAEGPNGWSPVPWDVAKSRGVLDEDDIAEVSGALVFFMVISSVAKRSQIAEKMKEASLNWGFATVLLNSTEYAASLPTSMKDAVTGEKMRESLVPS